MPLASEPASLNDHIVVATTPDDFEAFGVLIRDYVLWCRRRYRHDPWFIEQALSHQMLAEELADLASRYSPPNGKALLACRDGQFYGCCAYRRRAERVCGPKPDASHATYQRRSSGRGEWPLFQLAARGEPLSRFNLASAGDSLSLKAPPGGIALISSSNIIVSS